LLFDEASQTAVIIQCIITPHDDYIWWGYPNPGSNLLSFDYLKVILLQLG